VALFYADASALVKLVRDEPETIALPHVSRRCTHRLVRARPHRSPSRRSSRGQPRSAAANRFLAATNRRVARRACAAPCRPDRPRRRRSHHRTSAPRAGRHPCSRRRVPQPVRRIRHLRRTASRCRAPRRPTHYRSRELSTRRGGRAGSRFIRRAKPCASGNGWPERVARRRGEECGVRVRLGRDPVARRRDTPAVAGASPNAPSWIRTSGLPLRRGTLCPAELSGRVPPWRIRRSAGSGRRPDRRRPWPPAAAR
jgi:hypothetical protein